MRWCAAAATTRSVRCSGATGRRSASASTCASWWACCRAHPLRAAIRAPWSDAPGLGQAIADLREAGRNRGLRAARARQRDRRIPLRPRARRARRPVDQVATHLKSKKAKIMSVTTGRNVVVVGTQWGDEGKGKLVDWLTESAQGVVRFQGGHNAGHTLVINGVKTALAPDPQRHHAAGRQVLHRQRRGAVGGQAVRGNRRAGEGRRRSALAPAHQRGLPADPAVPCRARHRARGLSRKGRHREDRHHRPRHRPGLRRQDRAPRAARAGPEASGALRRQAARAARPAQPCAHAGARRARRRLRSRSSTRRCAMPNCSSR